MWPYVTLFTYTMKMLRLHKYYPLGICSKYNMWTDHNGRDLAAIWGILSVSFLFFSFLFKPLSLSLCLCPCLSVSVFLSLFLYVWCVCVFVEGRVWCWVSSFITLCLVFLRQTLSLNPTVRFSEASWPVSSRDLSFCSCPFFPVLPLSGSTFTLRARSWSAVLMLVQQTL